MKKKSEEPKNKLGQNQNEQMKQFSNQFDSQQQQNNVNKDLVQNENDQKATQKEQLSSITQDTPENQEQEQSYDEQQLKEIELMHNQHRQLQQQVDSLLDIPLKLYGWLEIPETKTAYMGERIFAENKIPKHVLLEHLYKIFQGSLYSMAEGDEEFLKEYCEKEFAEKILKNFSQYKEKGYKFIVEEDLSGIKGEPISKFYYIVDMALVRGLSINREENNSIQEYHKYVDIEDMGLVIYTPLKVTNPENFIDPEQNKTIYDSYKKMICRVLAYIRTPLRMRVISPDGNEIKIDENMYTWEHLAVFETQMIEPPKFKSFYKLENYMEWMGKFKFGTWKMVDLDNWVLGNPLVKQDPSKNYFQEEIFKGSKYDRKAKIDIRDV